MRALQYLTQSTNVAGSDPAPATKKTLGIPRCAEDLLVFGIVCVAIHWDPSHGYRNVAPERDTGT